MHQSSSSVKIYNFLAQRPLTTCEGGKASRAGNLLCGALSAVVPGRLPRPGGGWLLLGTNLTITIALVAQWSVQVKETWCCDEIWAFLAKLASKLHWLPSNQQQRLQVLATCDTQDIWSRRSLDDLACSLRLPRGKLEMSWLARLALPSGYCKMHTTRCWPATKTTILKEISLSVRSIVQH